MALDQKKYEHKHETILRDVRPLGVRLADAMQKPTYSFTIFLMIGALLWMSPWTLAFGDVVMVGAGLYFWWLKSRDRSLVFKLPFGAKYPDMHNGRAGKPGKAEGILYLGNVEKTNEEAWFTNSDARTHVLYLGTTGAGKTEGLKSMVSNALCWGSGFVYVDGKADTDLWSSLSSLVRRLGRDDDLLVLNYMTGNSDARAPSNTMNPFSSGSASYLTNMLVQLMPEAEGDNAMWKERAVSLASAMLPVLTWKRDNQDMQMSVITIRDYLSLNNVIKLSRDDAVPTTLRAGMKGYLDTLPGFQGDAYDDEGNVKPPGPDTPQYDTTTANQQHGYLAMQFTRSLQSLGDDYGYIFDTQAADVDMVDVVLNRRILIVLIPALEKSGDEIANLGKIVAATMKGMMGSALGSAVEGSSATVIENKPTHSATPFMTVFDEVGYYTAAGMAVMAAQARSLGFCLIFSGQDIPAMKKRVREEANSILANCNIKIFGKLEDPTETKEFFEKTVGSAMVTEVSGFQMTGGSELGSYFDTQQAGVQLRPRAQYEDLRGFLEGQAVITFGDTVVDCSMFYSNPGFAKAMRVTRFMALPPTDEALLKHANSITKLRDLLVNKTWTAERADVAIETPPEIDAMAKGFRKFEKIEEDPIIKGIAAIVQVHAINNEIEPAAPPAQEAPTTDAAPASAAAAPNAAPQTPPAAAPTTPPASQTQPPVQTAQPPPTPTVPPAASQEESKKASPMGFFGANKNGETTPPPPISKSQQPQNWDEISKESPAAQTPAAPQETPPPTTEQAEQNAPTEATKTTQPTSQKTKLPQELEDIIASASKTAKKSIFKDDEDIDAAE
ncbi:MAG: TraM recognition domain-containing protein [Alphaproteobacteria bacterium]|nr:TraM recognition domain-containing protein [Alphaproteobacteria bacterium]